MNQQQKESYTEPVLVVHELLRDVTGRSIGRRRATRSTTLQFKIGGLCHGLAGS